MTEGEKEIGNRQERERKGDTVESDRGKGTEGEWVEEGI